VVGFYNPGLVGVKCINREGVRKRWLRLLVGVARLCYDTYSTVLVVKECGQRPPNIVQDEADRPAGDLSKKFSFYEGFLFRTGTVRCGVCMYPSDHSLAPKSQQANSGVSQYGGSSSREVSPVLATHLLTTTVLVRYWYPI